MKRIIFSALLLGISGVGLAQETKPVVQEINLEAVTVSPIMNKDYRNMAIKGITSNAVVDLEEVAARYDVLEAPIYDRNMDAYEVMFKNSKGKILATYDHSGKILNTVERYQKIALPYAVSKTILSEYPGWELTNSNYLVKFRDGKDIKRVFRIKILNNGVRKTLKLNVDGEMMS